MTTNRHPSSDEFDALAKRVDKIETVMDKLRDAAVRGETADAAQAEQNAAIWGEIRVLREDSQKILASVTRAETITIHLSRALEQVPQTLVHHETELSAASHAITDHDQRIRALERADSSAAHRRKAFINFVQFCKAYWYWITAAVAVLAAAIVQAVLVLRG